MMSEEEVRAREENFRKFNDEMEARHQKAKEQGTSDSPEHFKEMMAIGKKYGMPMLGLAETPGEMIPEVDPGKLKDAWDRGGLGFVAAESSLARDPEMMAVRLRCAQLKLMERIETTGLPPGAPDFSVLKKGGQITNAALRVLARFPIKKPVLGVNPDAFNIAAFVEEVRKEESGQG